MVALVEAKRTITSNFPAQVISYYRAIEITMPPTPLVAVVTAEEFKVVVFHFTDEEARSVMLMLCFGGLPHCGAKNTCKHRTLTWFNLFLSLIPLLGDGDGG